MHKKQWPPFVLLVVISAVLVVGPACESVGDVGPAGGRSQRPDLNSVGSGAPDGGLPATRPGSGGAGGAAPGGSGGGTAQSGLPCDVQALLSARCTTCHTNPPLNGVPMPLLTLADLTAPARSDPSRTVAGMALARMQDNVRPMPPAPMPRASAAEIAAFSGWVGGGYTAPACGGGAVPAGGGGATGGGPVGSAGGSSAAGGASGGTGGSAGSGGGGGGGSPGSSGLPCDLESFFGAKCTSCHAARPLAGVPMSLVTYADLTSPAKSDPTKTVAQLAVARMQSSASPMPPAPGTPATAAQIAAVSSWIAAGYPTGTCGGGTGGASGGAGGSAGAGGGGGAGGPGPYDTPPTCTSGQYWAGGGGSSLMNPGLACINCHSNQEDAPRFTIAGTLYPTAHEYDRCDGVNGSNGARVIVTDAGGRTVTLTPNSAGNFYYTGTITTPIHAKVSYMGRERIMSAGQTTGDCNGCHTQSGANSAPGRILLP